MLVTWIAPRTFVSMPLWNALLTFSIVSGEDREVGRNPGVSVSRYAPLLIKISRLPPVMDETLSAASCSWVIELRSPGRMCTFGFEAARAVSLGDEVVLRTSAKTMLEGVAESWRMCSNWLYQL